MVSARMAASAFEAAGILGIAGGLGMLAPWAGLLAFGLGVLLVGVSLELGQSGVTVPRAVAGKDPRTQPLVGVGQDGEVLVRVGRTPK